MRLVQRATGAPLDLSADGQPSPPGWAERWKLPLTAVLLVAAAVGVALWLVRSPVEQPIAVPTPGGDASRPLKVHVTGAVANPGLYALPRSARVDDAIREAGGALAEADTTHVNLASPLRDGQQVVVPVLPAAQATPVPGAPVVSAAAASPATSGGIPRTPAARATHVPTPGPNNKLNLNRATAAELEALPGVGAATAKRIVDARDKNGAFQSTEDLRKARLVTNRAWDQIKDIVEAP